MSKQPYIPLYIGDWKKDADCLSIAAQGALLNLIFKLHDAPKRGVFEANFRVLSLLFKTDLAQTKDIFTEIFLDTKVLDFDTIEDGKFLIKSRRMIRESDISQKRSESGKKSAESKKSTKPQQKSNKPSTKHQQIPDIDIDIIYNKIGITNADFKLVFGRWMKYKKGRGESYKKKDTLETACRNLAKYSDSDALLAEEIINQAIGNNWAGFFELKNNEAKTKNKHEATEVHLNLPYPEPIRKVKSVYE